MANKDFEDIAADNANQPDKIPTTSSRKVYFDIYRDGSWYFKWFKNAV